MNQNKLVNALAKATNTARTENDAESYASTLSNTLDFFGKVGALRGQPAMAKQLFVKALSENRLDAMKILFYGRDVRGGQGEKQTFQACLAELVEVFPELVAKNLHLIPEFGCWKDLWSLFGTPFEKDVLDLIEVQLTTDVENLSESKSVSLLAKWLPSENTSSKDSQVKAKKIRTHLGMSSKEYRKVLSRLRAELKVVERDLSSKNFDAINYSHVPSRASMLYSKAFKKHDEARYTSFITSVNKGEAKINSSTLYPYEIVSKLTSGYGLLRPANLQTLEALWKNLPNYLEGKPHRGIVVADVSGSMFGAVGGVSPIHVSLSLAVYMAERLEGPFRDKCLTFSDRPSFMTLKGQTLYEKLSNVNWREWGMSTNIQSVFNLILSTAVANRVDVDEMPDTVYIVSDMQFNSCASGTNLDGIREKYRNAGYPLPKLVFWNVRSGADVPITQHDENTALVSGCNPNIFEAVIAGKTPIDVMRAVLDSERYAKVRV